MCLCVLAVCMRKIRWLQFSAWHLCVCLVDVIIAISLAWQYPALVVVALIVVVAAAVVYGDTIWQYGNETNTNIVSLDTAQLLFAVAVANVAADMGGGGGIFNIVAARATPAASSNTKANTHIHMSIVVCVCVYLLHR